LGFAVHFLPDWLPLTFKKIGKRGLEMQKKMHFWGWEQVEKHHVRSSIMNKTAIATRIPDFLYRKRESPDPALLYSIWRPMRM
jgi:hypothetical protein